MSTPATTREKPGVRRRVSRRKRLGKTPTRPAAIAVWPQASSVQLMQPSVETRAPTATSVAAGPPAIPRPASASGDVEALSRALGTRPMTANATSKYTTVTVMMLVTRARGMVFCWSFTSSAGTVIPSNPTKVQNVRANDDANRPSELPVPGLSGGSVLRWTKNSPTSPTNNSGISLRIVVTRPTTPASLTPRMLMATRLQMSISPMAAESTGLAATAGIRTPRYEVKAMAMPAQPDQSVIQYLQAMRNPAKSPNPARA